MKWLHRHRWLPLYSHMSGKIISIDTSRCIYMSQVRIVTGTGSTIRSSFFRASSFASKLPLVNGVLGNGLLEGSSIP